MKYKLLKDCPHGKAGSVWRREDYYEYSIPWILLRKESDKQEVFIFPSSTFSDWFEEIKEIPKFTKEQTEAIRYQLWDKHSGSPSTWKVVDDFEKWLDENTEK